MYCQHKRSLTCKTWFPLDLSSLRLKDVVDPSENQTSLAFVVGDASITIRMDVLGNVPSYKMNCSR